MRGLRRTFYFWDVQRESQMNCASLLANISLPCLFRCTPSAEISGCVSLTKLTLRTGGSWFGCLNFSCVPLQFITVVLDGCMLVHVLPSPHFASRPFSLWAQLLNFLTGGAHWLRGGCPTSRRWLHILTTHSLTVVVWVRRSYNVSWRFRTSLGVRPLLRSLAPRWTINWSTCQASSIVLTSFHWETTLSRVSPGRHTSRTSTSRSLNRQRYGKRSYSRRFTKLSPRTKTVLVVDCIFSSFKRLMNIYISLFNIYYTWNKFVTSEFVQIWHWDLLKLSEPHD